MVNDDWKYALGALAAVGVGALAYAAMTGETRRRTFQDALRGALHVRGVGLVNATLARAAGLPVWLVVVNHPQLGIHTYRIEFGQQVDPYSQETLNEVLGTLFRQMPSSEWGG